MKDRTGEVWNATHFGQSGGAIFVMLSSHVENRMHRCLILDIEGHRWKTGDIMNIGEWDDRNPMWLRIA